MCVCMCVYFSLCSNLILTGCLVFLTRHIVDPLSYVLISLALALYNLNAWKRLRFQRNTKSFCLPVKTILGGKITKYQPNQDAVV